MWEIVSVYLLIFRSRPFSRSHIGRYWDGTVSVHLVSLHRIPSYSSSVPWASILLVPISYGYSTELLFYSSRYPADISWTFARNIKERECGYPSHQPNSNFLSSHRLISFLSSPHLTNESLKRTTCWFPGHMLRPKHVWGVWRLYSKPSGVWNFKRSEQSQRRGKVRQSFFSWGSPVTNDQWRNND